MGGERQPTITDRMDSLYLNTLSAQRISSRKLPDLKKKTKNAPCCRCVTATARCWAVQQMALARLEKTHLAKQLDEFDRQPPAWIPGSAPPPKKITQHAIKLDSNSHRHNTGATLYFTLHGVKVQSGAEMICHPNLVNARHVDRTTTQHNAPHVQSCRRTGSSWIWCPNRLLAILYCLILA